MEEKESRLLARAIAIAAEAHQNQLDKAGAPYILHPMRMMEKAKTTAEKMVAVLHDVIEDSDKELEDLKKEGFSKEVLDAVDCLTHRKDEDYDQFTDRVLTNPLAMQVKLLDLEDNMTLTRLSRLTEKDLERVQKYHSAHRRIMEALAHDRG